ncbi:MAG TPA: hypothetical protein VNS63_26855 [Blastocatellia bacterium]|nr:hypothetical protein [Blastocatellia bacterium]
MGEYVAKCGGGDPPPVPVRPPVLDSGRSGSRNTQKSHIVTPGKVGAAVGIGVGVYVTYRVARMIPSLAPPLWWTIPINAAAP